jgi:methyl-accepting chemotaxis protein
MFIPILIILSFLFAILAVGLYYQNSRKVYALYSREIAAKVEVRSQYLASLFEGIKGQMDVLANTKEVMEGDLENILLLLQRMHTVKGDYINDYFFSALDGLTLTSSSPARVNIQDRPYFREAVSSGVIAFSDPVVSRLDGRIIIIVANPVKKDGKTIGVVSATVEVKSLDQVFSRNILTETGRYVLLSREGVVVYHPREEYVGQQVGKDIVDDGKDTVGIEKVLTEPSRRFFSYILEGRRSTSYKVEIPLTGYILLFSLDSSDFITPLNSVILQLIIFFLSLIAILCAVLALVARSFSREITDRKAAEEVLRESERSTGASSRT